MVLPSIQRQNSKTSSKSELLKSQINVPVHRTDSPRDSLEDETALESSTSKSQTQTIPQAIVIPQVFQDGNFYRRICVSPKKEATECPVRQLQKFLENSTRMNSSGTELPCKNRGPTPRYEIQRKQPKLICRKPCTIAEVDTTTRSRLNNYRKVEPPTKLGGLGPNILPHQLKINEQRKTIRNLEKMWNKQNRERMEQGKRGANYQPAKCSSTGQPQVSPRTLRTKIPPLVMTKTNAEIPQQKGPKATSMGPIVLPVVRLMRPTILSASTTTANPKGSAELRAAAIAKSKALQTTAEMEEMARKQLAELQALLLDNIST